MVAEDEKVVDLGDLSAMLREVRPPPPSKRESLAARATADGAGGRVYEAIFGGRGQSFETKRVPGSADDGVAFFRVSFGPRVVVRSSPSLAGSVVGARQFGEVVKAVARSNDMTWIKLADGFRETKQWSNLRDAYMMVEHPDYGVLMRRVGGLRMEELPEEYLRLGPSSAAGAKREESEAASLHYFKVIHAPSVLVRDHPSMSGRIVRALRTGAIFRATEKEGEPWLEIDSKSFVQSRHPELGLFVQRCQADGTTYFW